MAEDLTTDDVEAYTHGRLLADDPETLRALNAALARARSYCGWHVSPVRKETLIVNGNGRPLLFLKTMKVVELLSIVEDGVEIDVEQYVRQDAEAPGVIAKVGWEPWEYGFSNLEVELRHGYTAAEAADFRESVLALIDRASLAVGTEGQGPLIEKEVDDVRYRWASSNALSAGVANEFLDESSLYQYRLLPL